MAWGAHVPRLEHTVEDQLGLFVDCLHIGGLLLAVR